MIEKYLIVVDDEDQTPTLRNIARHLKENEGIKLVYVQINSKEAKYQSYDDSSDLQLLDLEKMINGIMTIEFFKRADVIALDYNLSDKVKGYELAPLIRKNGYHSRKEIILYSGKIDDAINEILNYNSVNDKIEAIKSLTKSNLNFATRGNDYANAVIQQIKKSPIFDFDADLLVWLDKFSNNIFLGVFPNYHGMTMGDIAAEIRKGTALSEEFKKVLIEQLYSILIEINEFE